MVNDFLKWWIYLDGKYTLQGVDLLEKLEELPAHRAMNLLDYILLDDGIEDAKLEGELRKSRARLDALYENGVPDEESGTADLPEEVLYDVEHMDPEYVRKAQGLRTNKKTDLNYVQPGKNGGFAALGSLGVPIK